jgi:hypothetical protein
MLSPNEVKLFKSIKCLNPEMLKVAFEHPIKVYEYAAIKVFSEGEQGPHIDALRRAVSHLGNCKYRGNDEFDKLIEF